jgi:hypothetical protein
MKFRVGDLIIAEKNFIKHTLYNNIDINGKWIAKITKIDYDSNRFILEYANNKKVWMSMVVVSNYRKATETDITLEKIKKIFIK